MPQSSGTPLLVVLVLLLLVLVVLPLLPLLLPLLLLLLPPPCNDSATAAYRLLHAGDVIPYACFN
jgi:hypothetical protein